MEAPSTRCVSDGKIDFLPPGCRSFFSSLFIALSLSLSLSLFHFQTSPDTSFGASPFDSTPCSLLFPFRTALSAGIVKIEHGSYLFICPFNGSSIFPGVGGVLCIEVHSTGEGKKPTRSSSCLHRLNRKHSHTNTQTHVCAGDRPSEWN